VIIGKCTICGDDVDDVLHSVARRIVGWERVRKERGANAIIDRRELGHIAHTECAKRRAKRRRAGIADQQGTLT
jgi:hypothetical protein